MNLKTLKLENIRSYTHQEITFPEGITLLSGDVGAGKSTLLLAIEFALFGIQKGGLNGETLLRKGTTKGRVTLTLDIDGNTIRITRNLQKGTSITQDSAALTINGELQHLTPVELKQRILTLLNYPQELLTKKSPIYRYTVYTPQEEMKHILYGDQELRLDTLRKLFGIDKYKRIKENTKIYITYLKSQRKHYEGILQDYEEKYMHAQHVHEQLTQLTTEFEQLQPKLTTARIQEQEHKKHLETLTTQLSQHQHAQQQLTFLQEQLQQKIAKTRTLNETLAQLNDHVQSTPEQPTVFNQEELLTLQQQHETLQNEQRTHERELATLTYKLQTSNNLVNAIASLQHCPTCKQEVTENHKHTIKTQEQTTIQTAQERHTNLTATLKQLQEQAQYTKTQLEKTLTKKHSYELALLKYQRYQEHLKQKIQREEELAQTKKDIGNINIQLQELQHLLQNYDSIKHLRENAQTQYEEHAKKLQELTMHEVRLTTTKETLTKQHEQLQKELEHKQASKTKLANTSSLINWMQDSFIPSLETMEQQVMLTIHHDFNTYYKQWFTLLMGSEELLTRLDETFNPTIEQNGHTIEYGNLSGGEQTAVALAYRLALNHVINTLIVDIKTKDLIILDEPTDGFSHEQINRIQLILEELAIKQVLIVSHEPKIEGFVDHIIRIEKHNHTSKIAQE